MRGQKLHFIPFLGNGIHYVLALFPSDLEHFKMGTRRGVQGYVNHEHSTQARCYIIALVQFLIGPWIPYTHTACWLVRNNHHKVQDGAHTYLDLFKYHSLVASTLSLIFQINPEFQEPLPQVQKGRGRGGISLEQCSLGTSTPQGCEYLSAPCRGVPAPPIPLYGLPDSLTCFLDAIPAQPHSWDEYFHYFPV